PLPEVDRRPFAVWLADNSARIVPDPAATADDLTLAIDLVDWVAHGSEGARDRAERTIDRVLAVEGARIVLALRTVDLAEAQRYHAVAAPLSGRPQAERDP